MITLLRSRTLPMLALRRLATVPLVLLALASLVFVAMRQLPGSPSSSLAVGGTQGLTAEEISANEARINEALGLDRPIWEQYLTYLGDLARLDLGSSFYGGNSVLSLLAGALPATIELTIAAMAIAVVLGVVSGVIAALRKDTWIDTATRSVATVSFSLPWFALGVLSIVIFGVWLRWLPVLGRLPSQLDYRPTTNFVLLDAVLQDRPELIWPWLQYLILPATTLALAMAGFITRIVRASVLEVLSDDFVRTARMKGLREGRILRKHVLRNSGLPIVTVLGLQFGSLLGGSVITEQVFSYPGVGNLLVSSVLQRDYPVVQGAALAIALLFVLVNAAVDIFYLVLDPRLRKG
ncbi:ABC transporter permease [Natronosporangium hydrolyticum]|uniref:ABC transporter permease n=1 Tax=Natronosporangium hydrolyticum TaxID=2811111 RepID=A0A895YK60_9ACTN|nr:ABC transporter permease [Natronosporangium hydrolyticum]QSB15889.1 ABC transporter permease [Natronosporangium hydrolyticum]